MAKTAKKKQKTQWIKLEGIKARRGDRLTKGPYRLFATQKKKRVFVASLIGTINRGNNRFAIFSVPK